MAEELDGTGKTLAGMGAAYVICPMVALGIN
jgi:hypothetical protein